MSGDPKATFKVRRFNQLVSINSNYSLRLLCVAGIGGRRRNGKDDVREETSNGRV